MVGGGVAGPAEEQGPLDVDVQHGPGERRLSAEGQPAGGVGEDELATLGPGEEPPQNVGPLVASGRGASEEVLQVRGGDLGPAGDGAAGVQVRGEVAQDAQPGLQGDVAEGALPGAAAAVLLADLGVVELGDGVSSGATTAATNHSRRAAARWRGLSGASASP